MAYYAALVSLVELLKEMSDPIPGHRYPKYLFQKQQITRLYEKFSHLQVLLEDYYPRNDKEADGFLERIRDVACRVEHFIERQTSDAAYPKLKKAYHNSESGSKSKSESESESESGPRPEPELENDGVVETTRKGYQDFLKLKEVFQGYQALLKLMEVLGHVVEVGYDDLEKLKKEFDSIMAEGYLDVVKLKEELDSIEIKGYQNLVKLKEELDAIIRRGHQNLERVKEELDAIIRRGHQDLERVKEEVDYIVGKGYDDLLEKVLKNEVDPIVEEMMMRIKESHTTHQEDLQVNIDEPSDDGNTMVVLDENPITKIKDQILGDSSKHEVISIVGMGGIGKTTLARYIFDDKHIRNHFDFHVWFTVSQSYHLPNILQAIAKSLNISKEDLNGAMEDKLKERIYKHLFGQRYLVIIDDVWDLKILDDVKWMFPTNPNGSRIMITTRQSDLASVASASDFINQIPTLTQHQSWTLLCEKVHCPPELEDIGRLIVKHCGGLPLAIVVVTGLLKTNKTRDHWEYIAGRVSSAVAESDEHFLKILSLSYDHLPHHLKPCFLYLGGFPEDHEISISRLVKLWVAEGFLKPIASKCLEEAAEEYLEELVKRNLVLVTKWRSNGKFKSCSMHDLLRDLCLERARREHFLLLPHKHIAAGHAHRFFIHPYSPFDIDMQKNNVRHVRSIVSFGRKDHDFILHLSSFKPLRILHAPFKGSDIPFDRIFEFINLRSLELYCFRSQWNIPSSISKLQHLQTLIARENQRFSCSEVSLPAEIWKMPQLRHVLIDQNIKFPDGGRKTSDRLPSLQTLSTPVNFTFTSRIAEMIPSIKKLKLKYIQEYERCKNAWTMFGLTNLIRLHQLETLAIIIDIYGGIINVAMPFTETFAFPSNLRKLTLRGCRLPWEDMTVVGTLPHLQVLKLRYLSFVGKEWESNEGEFSSLKFLEMSELFIKNWQTESSHFPRLEHLVIKGCHYLNGIPSEIGEFPNLKLIEVWSGNSRLEASALEIQEEQSSVGNEILEVRVN